MAQRAAFALLLGTSVAVLFAAIATAGDVQYAERSPAWPGVNTANSTNKPRKPQEPPPIKAETLSPTQARLAHIGEVLLNIVFVASIAFVVGLVLVYAWRNRPSFRRQAGRRRQSHFEMLDEVATVIGAQAEAQRAALLHGSPRNAIVECWLLLENAVVAAGVAHDPADTSTDLAVRVLSNLRVDQLAIERLAALYREARFSDHAMGEDARRAAIDALDHIHDGLRAGGDRMAPAT